MDYLTKRRLAVADGLWRNIIKPRYFRLEPEPAHERMLKDLDRLHRFDLIRLLRIARSPYCDMPTTVFGSPWRNPYCVPAGFVKQFEIPLMLALDELGAGAIAGGTVVPEPQPGNIGDRLWRFEKHRALVNWYGFNSDGDEVCLNRLRTLLKVRPNFIPVGISIGKNAKTPPDDFKRVVADYVRVAKRALPVMRLRDWLEFNISSPNTEGLRGIFEWYDEFIDAVTREVRLTGRALGHKYVHCVVKVFADGLTEERADFLITTSSKYDVDIVVPNTIIDPELKKLLGMYRSDGTTLLPGGVSGNVIRERSLEAVKLIGKLAVDRNVDIVAGGGLSTRWDVKATREAGGKAVKGTFALSAIPFDGPHRVIHEHLEGWKMKVLGGG